MTSIQSLDLNAILADPESLHWVAHDSHGRRGSRVHVLFHCPSTGQQVALVQSEPGSFAQEHRHEGHETIVVLRGSFEDQHGLHTQGELVHYPPGSRHAWTSAEGGLMYVVWGGRVSNAGSAAAASSD